MLSSTSDLHIIMTLVLMQNNLNIATCYIRARLQLYPLFVKCSFHQGHNVSVIGSP